MSVAVTSNRHRRQRGGVGEALAAGLQLSVVFEFLQDLFELHLLISIKMEGARDLALADTTGAILDELKDLFLGRERGNMGGLF